MNYGNTHLRALPLLLLLLTSASCQKGKKITEDTSKSLNILVVGGAVAETVCALGYCDSIVARDRTAVYPEQINKLPSVGFQNSIKAEGIISAGVNKVFAKDDVLAQEVINQLKASGIDYYGIKSRNTVQGAKNLILELGTALNEKKKAEALVKTLEEDLKKAEELVKKSESKPKVLFVYARGQGTLNIGGKGTFAEEIIRLAGGELAVKDISDFKPLTSEAVIASNPDYILFFTTGLASIGGKEGALAIPGVAATTAGKKKQIIALDGSYISDFGPRLGKAVYDLAALIHTGTAVNKNTEISNQ